MSEECELVCYAVTAIPKIYGKILTFSCYPGQSNFPIEELLVYYTMEIICAYKCGLIAEECICMCIESALR